MKKDYPILEFDPCKKAVISTSEQISDIHAPENCVLCFFGEVVSRFAQQSKAEILKRFRWECGTFTLFASEYSGKPFCFMHCGVGAPQAAAHIEELYAVGCRKVIACGSAGVLDSSLAAGHLIIPTSAVRDEGASYHYLPPSRYVDADTDVVDAISAVLDKRLVKYGKGRTWTTDAPYRETRGIIELRKKENCLTVEMECAAFMAASRFKGVKFGQILYCGDDISGEEWDTRGWTKMKSVREKLFRLAVESCFEL